MRKIKIKPVCKFCYLYWYDLGCTKFMRKATKLPAYPDCYTEKPVIVKQKEASCK